VKKAVSDGVEKESEDDGIPAAKKQKKSWEAPGAASSKEQDPDEHTPQKAGGSGNTAPLKLHSDKPEWGIVYDALRSHWRVHTGLNITWWSFKNFGGDEIKAYEAAKSLFERAMSRRVRRTLQRVGEELGYI